MPKLSNEFLHEDIVAELVMDESEASATRRPIPKWSNKKRNWRCRECSNVYTTSPARRSKGDGCPYCSGRAVLKGFNDLETVSPVVAGSWHPSSSKKPSEVTQWSSVVLNWTCDNEHIYAMSVRKRSRGLGCNICRGYTVVKGVNDLNSKNESVARQLRGADGSTVYYRSKSVREWECDSGHAWSTTVYSRTVTGTGCPYCANVKVLKGFNDAATTDAWMLEEWSEDNEVRLTEVTSGSKKKMWWKCKNNHKWKAAVYSRKTKGCPSCAHFSSSKIESDVLTELDKILNHHKVKRQVKISGAISRPIIVDGLISPNIVIEYDGSYWHKDNDTVKLDTMKTRGLTRLGYRVIRVRESNDTELKFLRGLGINVYQIRHRLNVDTAHATAQKIADKVIAWNGGLT